MADCITPEQIKQGDLIAYVEGEADEAVREHVACCAACADKVARLRQTSQALIGLMYRSSCPPSEVLGKYQLDLLSAGERLKIAAHARGCPHCTRELDELVREEDSLTQMILQVIQGAVRVVEGALVPHSLAHRARAEGKGIESKPYVFQGAGLDVLVGFDAAVPGGRKGTLTGTVVQAGMVAGGQAWLFQEGERPRASQVDGQGIFAFEGIRLGRYDLALEVGEEALLMREVVVDGP